MISWVLMIVGSLLLLAGIWQFSAPAPTDKDDTSQYWLYREVTTQAELQQEIDALLADNEAGGITAAKLRKVFHDSAKLK